MCYLLVHIYQKPLTMYYYYYYLLILFYFHSLQELLHSSRKLSLKVLSFVQSFQVRTFRDTLCLHCINQLHLSELTVDVFPPHHS